MRNAVLATLLFLGATITVAAQSVYVANTGSKYHKETCFHLKESKSELDFEKARKLKYEACKHCKPLGYKNGTSPSSLESKLFSRSKSAVAAQCIVKTKAGSRCKRKTKNSNGRCYQH